VQKMKWEYMGQIGTADFDFDVASQRFNVKVKEDHTRFAQVVLNT